MRLVTSMMTIEELSSENISFVVEILTNKFPNNKYEVHKYRFEDRKYCEVDIDIFDVSFSKETIYTEIEDLISVFEEIIRTLPVRVEFIVGNDDTEVAVLRFEENCNDIKDFGLFVTNRTIPNIQPYYASQICNAYVNLTHVSFGVYD